MKASRTRNRSIAIAAVSLAAAAALAPIPGPAAFEALRFGPPVRISSEVSEAWEPVVLVDRFGNIFVHARKARSNLVVATDERSPTLTRSMSWLWISSDGGRTFANLDGLPLDLQNHNWGYEGDFALDHAGHLYFVDQQYADSTITRWTVTGRGQYAFDFHRPFVPTGQPLEDRPWLAARGDGTLVYLVNAGNANLNPVGARDGGDAYGLGRYALYRSTDGGQTFDAFGRSLNDSGACRPAADRRPGSLLIYVVCTNDGGAHGLDEVPSGRGTLWAYVSEDDGATFSRHRIGDYNADAETYDWPLVTVGPNGDVWALHHDAAEVEGTGDAFRIVANKLMLYHSSDKGRTWSRRDITPRRGRYRWGWLAASPGGRLGLGVQHRPNDNAPWRVYGSVFEPGSMPSLVSVDDGNPVDAASRPEPPSEMVGIAFAPDETLNVAWTRVENVAGQRFLSVYFTTSLPAKRPDGPKVRGERRTRTLPATGVHPLGFAGAATLTSSLALAGWARSATRRRSRRGNRRT